MHISLFGGAFDPPHLGHLQVINSILSSQVADELWLVPTGVHDFEKIMQSATDRLEMLKLLIKETPANIQNQIKIERCELERAGVSHTLDTLDDLSQKYPQYHFSFVIGSDNLEKFHLWYGYRQILEKYQVFVYPRKDYSTKSIYQGMVPLTQVPQIDISSSMIKTRINNNQSIAEYLPNSILDFITQKKLYLS